MMTFLIITVQKLYPSQMLLPLIFNNQRFPREESSSINKNISNQCSFERKIKNQEDVDYDAEEDEEQAVFVEDEEQAGFVEHYYDITDLDAAVNNTDEEGTTFPNKAARQMPGMTTTIPNNKEGTNYRSNTLVSIIIV